MINELQNRNWGDIEEALTDRPLAATSVRLLRLRTSLTSSTSALNGILTRAITKKSTVRLPWLPDAIARMIGAPTRKKI